MEWRGVAYAEQSRGVVCRSVGPLQLPLLAMSPLCRHIDALFIAEHGKCSLSDLQLIQRLSSLTRLAVQLDGDALLAASDAIGDLAHAAAVVGRMLPTNLRFLEVHLTEVDSDEHDNHITQRLLVEAIGRPPRGPRSLPLKELTLHFNAHSKHVELTRLQNLHSLSNLTLKGWKLDEETVKDLRELGSLTSLTGNEGQEWTPKLLTVLTVGGLSRTKLKNLRYLYLVLCHLTAAHMRGLAKLPALEELHCDYFLPDAVPHLASLRSLTSLNCCMDDVEEDNSNAGAEAVELIIRHLRGCVQLRKLEVGCFSFTDADVKALVAAVPQLEVCTFEFSKLASLAGLQKAQQLRELTIRQCKDSRLAQMTPLVDIKSLRNLTVSLPEEEHAMARVILDSDKFQHLEVVQIDVLLEALKE